MERFEDKNPMKGICSTSPRQAEPSAQYNFGICFAFDRPLGQSILSKKPIQTIDHLIVGKGPKLCFFLGDWNPETWAPVGPYRRQIALCYFIEHSFPRELLFTR